MKSDQSNASGQSSSSPPRSGTVWILIVIAILAGGVGAYWALDRSETEDVTAGKGVPSVEEKAPGEAPRGLASSMTGQPEIAPAIAPLVRGSTGIDYARQDHARELLTEVLEIKPAEGKFSVAQISEINQLLRELQQQGAAALPAIREYLESMNDLDFTAADNSKAANYATLRIGLIDALGQIEGSESKQVLLQTLDVSAAPKEIAMLARSLEGHAGNEYSPEIQMATLETLDLMAESEVSGQDEDVGFLFAVLERHGGGLADVMEETYPRWKTYSAMTLAKLPDGEGVPALVRLAEQNPETGREKGSPLQMLAQASREHPTAAEALVQMAASAELTNASWRRIAKTLGGEEYRFRSEMFERTSGHGASLGKPSTVITGLSIQAHHKWSDAEIDQRIELIDRLSRIAPVDTTGALEQARARLSSWRETRLVAGVRGTR